MLNVALHIIEPFLLLFLGNAYSVELPQHDYSKWSGRVEPKICTGPMEPMPVCS